MRFVELLRATVLLCAGSATALIAVTLITSTQGHTETLARIATGWWALAIVIGLVLSRREHANAAIARLMANARQATMMPDVRPAATLMNRLWPLLLIVVAAGTVAGVAGPQVPAIVAGVTIIWALAWRRQAHAVLAIEERDGVTFFVVRTAPWRRIRLERMPGFRRERLADEA